jgi:hypothetical protein
LLVSEDSGASWELRAVDPGPRVHDDVHFITGHPDHPNLLFAALGGALLSRENLQPPGQPRRIGGVARSDDGGLETPMPDMVERFEPAPDGSIWAVCSGGRLFRAMPGEWQWSSPVPAAAAITADSVSFVAA